MSIKPEVLTRLLLSKAFLARIRFQTVAVHDTHTLASHIITSHDSAELAIAAICDQLGSLPQPGKSYLMDYIAALKEHTKADVPARGYFDQLNAVRNNIKHRGLFPDAKQWARVGDTTFQHLTKWCWDYLGLSFSELDDATLITNKAAKEFYDQAKALAGKGQNKETLECLALGLQAVFRDNSALRGFEVGQPKAEDAIRLAGFGVHGNDFLALQQFLPRIRTWGKDAGIPQWKQSKYGHPGNWTEQAVEFCCRTFVDITIKIQDAQWIPGALERVLLYEQRIEALKDGVEMWKEVPERTGSTRLELLSGPTRREVARTLKQGEQLAGTVSVAEDGPFNAFFGGRQKTGKTLNFWSSDLSFYGYVSAADVKVTCVPRKSESMTKYYAWLAEIEWEPE